MKNVGSYYVKNFIYILIKNKRFQYNIKIQLYKGDSEEEFGLVRLEGVEKVPDFEGKLVVVEGFGCCYFEFVDKYQRVEK